MLLECAIGDAYGFGFEYADVNLPLNDLTRYVQHPTYGLEEGITPGRYTDDTQMSIAVAEMLVNREFMNEYTLAHKFVETFKRDRRKGYSKEFQKILEGCGHGLDLLARIRPASNKSGAAMRAAPLGVLSNREAVVEHAIIQANVTHNTPEGRWAAVAAALMSHYFLHTDHPKRELAQWIRIWCVQAGDTTDIRWAEPWVGKVGALGWMSVRAAMTAIVQHDSMSEILKACVAFSGDVDTVSAIALSAASCSREIQQDLPQSLINGLENGPYGADFLRALDKKLLALR